MLTVTRGMARDKSMCGAIVLGGPGMPPQKILISYIGAAAFWDILRHVLKETIFYFATFAKLKKIYFSLK